MAFKLPTIQAPSPERRILTPSEAREESERMKAMGAAGLATQEAQQQANLAKTVAENMKRWHADPWAMVRDQVIYTLDQVDFDSPVKKFPAHPWLEKITREWQANKLIAIPKSRRMMITWLTVYLHLWLAMWHPGVAAFFVSESERKSEDMIKKAEFMFRHIPEDVMLKPKVKTRQCLIEFPGLDSYIMGIPEGENQLRQYTATAILFDEWAFWKDPQATLGAAKPCTQGGGRLTVVSTPGKECFYDLCFDQTM